jgi:hypothetical protein
MTPTHPARNCALALLVVLAAACGGDDRPGEGEVAAHEVLATYLQATAEQDWDTVYDLTADHARPNNRANWFAAREDRPGDPHVHRCVGQPTGRPTIDLTTVENGYDSLVVEASVWVSDDQATTCRWQLTAEPAGWRVGSTVDRDLHGPTSEVGS